MKSIAILTFAFVLILAGTVTAEAGSYPPVSAKRYVNQKNVCKPVYVRTKVVKTRTECRWYTDACGKRRAYEVKVVTLADVYSDGSQKLYTRTIAG